MTGRALCIAVLAGAALAAPARADETLAELARPTPVDAWGGRIVWSDYDAASQRYRLMTSVGGGPATAVPVPTRARPFDADLGPGPVGSTVAAYSRCEGGCELYLYDFAANREERLAGPSTARADETLPSVWGNRVAFVREGKLYVSTLAGRQERRIRGGRGRYTAIDLNRSRLAFIRSHPHGEGIEYEMFLQKLGGRRRVVDRAASGLLSIVKMLRPSFDGGAIVYAIARYFDAGNRFIRYDIRSRRSREVASHRGIVSAAFDGGRFVYVQTQDEDGQTCTGEESPPTPCLLRRTDPIVF